MPGLTYEPIEIDGTLIDGEGREIVVAGDRYGWPAPAVLRIVGTNLEWTATVDGSAAVWTLTAEDVAAIKASRAPGLTHVRYQVTVGDGDTRRSVLVGVLVIRAPGEGDPGPRVGPVPVLTGPFGPVHVIIGPPGRSVASVSVDGDDLVFGMSDGSGVSLPVPELPGVAEAQAAAEAAQSARDEAQTIAQGATVDGAVAALVDDPDSATRAALSSTYVPRRTDLRTPRPTMPVAVPLDASDGVGDAARLAFTATPYSVTARAIGLDGVAYGVYNDYTLARRPPASAWAVTGAYLRVFEVGFTAGGGTFTLTVDGQTTSALAYTVTAADVKTALEALSSVGAGNVLVVDANGGSTNAKPFGIVLRGSAAAKVVTGTSSLTGLASAFNVVSAGILTIAHTHRGWVLWTSSAATSINRCRVWTLPEWNSTAAPVHRLGCASTTVAAFARPQAVAGEVWLMFGEYTVFTNPSVPLKRFLSTDGGETWNHVRSTKTASTAINSHHHAGLITAGGRLYSSEGDGPNAWFGYSDDRGTTWTEIKTNPAWTDVYDGNVYVQPTALIDFTHDDGRIAMAPDRGPFPPGIWDIDSRTGEITRNWDLTEGGPYTGAHQQYGMAYCGGNGREAYVLYPDTGSGNRRSIIGATGDYGRSWWYVGEVEWGEAGNASLSNGIVGPDINGDYYLKGFNLPTFGSGCIFFQGLRWRWATERPD